MKNQADARTIAEVATFLEHELLGLLAAADQSAQGLTPAGGTQIRDILLEMAKGTEWAVNALRGGRDTVFLGRSAKDRGWDVAV